MCPNRSILQPTNSRVVPFQLWVRNTEWTLKRNPWSLKRQFKKRSNQMKKTKTCSQFPMPPQLQVWAKRAISATYRITWLWTTVGPWKNRTQSVRMISDLCRINSLIKASTSHLLWKRWFRRASAWLERSRKAILVSKSWCQQTNLVWVGIQVFHKNLLMRIKSKPRIRNKKVLLNLFTNIYNWEKALQWIIKCNQIAMLAVLTILLRSRKRSLMSIWTLPSLP
jgi:hypothetical protein